MHYLKTSIIFAVFLFVSVPSVFAGEVISAKDLKASGADAKQLEASQKKVEGLIAGKNHTLQQGDFTVRLEELDSFVIVSRRGTIISIETRLPYVDGTITYQFDSQKPTRIKTIRKIKPNPWSSIKIVEKSDKNKAPSAWLDTMISMNNLAEAAIEIIDGQPDRYAQYRENVKLVHYQTEVILDKKFAAAYTLTDNTTVTIEQYGNLIRTVQSSESGKYEKSTYNLSSHYLTLTRMRPGDSAPKTTNRVVKKKNEKKRLRPMLRAFKKVIQEETNPARKAELRALRARLLSAL